MCIYHFYRKKKSKICLAKTIFLSLSICKCKSCQACVFVISMYAHCSKIVHLWLNVTRTNRNCVLKCLMLLQDFIFVGENEMINHCFLLAVLRAFLGLPSNLKEMFLCVIWGNPGFARGNGKFRAAFSEMCLKSGTVNLSWRLPQCLVCNC